MTRMTMLNTAVECNELDPNWREITTERLVRCTVSSEKRSANGDAKIYRKRERERESCLLYTSRCV